MKIPELLAPVGSMEHLKIAINAGASSIYLSGKDYGARAFAQNFTLDEIEKAVAIAHLHNVRVYVTVNTLIRESEIEEVLNYLNKLYAIGVDAVLIQDLGLIEMINKYLPDLKIHASTQINCENQRKLDYLESKNVKRVVLAREMKLDEIKNLNTNMELEIFAHGALCYSYSGQCLMSSFNGGRSGNRGRCAQPCRQKYRLSNTNHEDYYLSPRDLCLYNKLKEISDLNIKCIKIEGRMRSKEYLAIVISTYRKALNKLKSNKIQKTENLNLVFNRGFTEGMFSESYKRSLKSGHIGLKIGKTIGSRNSKIAVRLFDHINTIPQKGDGLLLVKKDNEYGLEISQNPLITTYNHFKKGKLKAVKDLKRNDKVLIIKKVRQNKKHDFDLADSTVYLTKRNELTKKTKEIENNAKSFIKSKLILTFSLKNKYPHLKGMITLANHKHIEAEAIGTIKFEKAKKRNVTRENIENQLRKVDNYPYDITHININYDGTQFIPIREINKIRRELFSKLSDEIIRFYQNTPQKITPENTEKTRTRQIKLSYYTNDIEQLPLIKGVERVYFELPPTDSINHMITLLKKAVQTPKDYELIWKWPDIAHDKLIKSLTKVRAILKKMNLNIEIMSNDFQGDYGPSSLNITNTPAINLLEDYKLLTLSTELSKKDYGDILENCSDNAKIEILIKGNVEVMKSRYSFKEYEKNSYLIDTKENKYPIYENLSGEEIIILNHKDLSRFDELEYLVSKGCVNFSIDGRWKDKNYIKNIEYLSDALGNTI